MPTPDPNLTITATPGTNEKVNNVINIEEILQKAAGGARDLANTGSAMSLEHGDRLAAIQKLAADLEDQLRALRTATPESSGDPPQR